MYIIFGNIIYLKVLCINTILFNSVIPISFISFFTQFFRLFPIVRWNGRVRVLVLPFLSKYRSVHNRYDHIPELKKGRKIQILRDTVYVMINGRYP